MTFRGKDGKYSPGVNLTLWDIRQLLQRLPGDHWILPPGGLPVGQRGHAFCAWRLPVRRFPELQGIYPRKSRPSLVSALWAQRHGTQPKRLRRTCKHKGCLNPLHHEEREVKPEEVYHTYFTKAMEFAENGQVLSLEFANEGAAIGYRQRLNSYRRKGLDERRLPEGWEELTLRIRKKPEGTFELFADLESALAEALGMDSLDKLEKQPSAVDLLEEDLK